MMNVEGLAIDLERCPDGVELIDLPATELVGPARTVFRYRTDRREPHRIRIVNLEDPVIIALINANDDEQRQSFFARFGLGSFLDRMLWWQGWEEYPLEGWRFIPDELHRDGVLKNQSRLRELLRTVGGQDSAAAMIAVNSVIAARPAFNLQPTFHLAGPRGTPRLLLKSQTFLGFMLAEMAMIVANGASVTECEKCGTTFLTGALTWRRSSARFCSDRCRVAANRAQRAGA
jgi:hypothetical protein